MNDMDSSVSDVGGTWYLVAEHWTAGQADLDASNYEHDGNGAWVRTSGVSVASVAAAAHGLTLEVSADGTFSETGESSIPLFDAAGVETIGEGFDGRLDVVGGRLVAFVDGRVNEPVSAIADPSVLRLSDGSVDIAEFFELSEGRLVRTQNVVTDGIYLVSSVLVYDRVPVDAPAPEVVAAQPMAAQVGARAEAEAALAAALAEGSPDGWKEVVAYVSADSSTLSTTTFAVVCDASGEHRLSQDFDPHPPLDALWKAHRSASKIGEGNKWIVAVVVVGVDQDAQFHVEYDRAPSTVRGNNDELFMHYCRGYLKVFLAENGLDK